jgi:formylglycine-generating enzyme required for sulfatase activity
MPELTVDRLVRLSLGPGTNMSVRVTLRAICMGRMASLAEAAGCVDEARLFAAAGPGDGPEDGRSSVAATLLDRARLTPPVAPAHAVAIAGGPLVLGSDDLGIGLPGASVAPSFPPLGAVVSGFAIDREEVSVVRMRAAVKSGFVPGALQENAGSLAKTSVDSLASCTYRSSPDPADPAREFLPVTCVGFDTARAFCQWEGGDLPTETQWEYAASMAGRAQKTRYPWGNDAPICEGVVFARFDDAAGGATGCHDRGFAFGLRGAPTVNMDVTAGGVRGLAGGASEWVRGAPFAYDSACFRRAGIIDPACDRDATEHVVRGGSFASTESVLVATFRGRMPVGGSTPAVGFRCVHGA